MVFFTEEFDFEDKNMRTTQRRTSRKCFESRVSWSQKHHETSTHRAELVAHSDNITTESGVCAMSNDEWRERFKTICEHEEMLRNLHLGESPEYDKMEVEWMKIDVNRAERQKMESRRESTISSTRSSSR